MNLDMTINNDLSELIEYANKLQAELIFVQRLLHIKQLQINEEKEIESNE